MIVSFRRAKRSFSRDMKNGFIINLFDVLSITERSDVSQEEKDRLSIDVGCSGFGRVIPIYLEVAPVNEFSHQLLSEGDEFTGFICYASEKPDGFWPTPLRLMHLQSASLKPQGNGEN